MMICTETVRKEQAIRYVQGQIDNLSQLDLRSDYHKDPASGIVYYPNCHPEEMRRAEHEKARWETLLAILTNDLPFPANMDQTTNIRRDA